MTRAAVSPGRGPAAPSGLLRRARALHRPRVDFLNPALLGVTAAFGLSVIGVVVIATVPASADHATKQIAFLCVAVIAAAVSALPHYRWLNQFSTPLMLIVLALLVFVLIPAVPEAIVRPRNGARRWISLGVADLQPSELAKIAYIIALASYLRYRNNYRRLAGLALPFVLTFIPMALVVVEPDLGTALLFVPTLLAMLVAAGAKLKHIVLVVVLGVAVASSLYPVLRPHQRDRIHAFYYQLKGDPRHVHGIGYQGDRAMTLAGAGRLAGVGRGKAADLVEYNHLPEQHNDMVFAVIACRWGLLGAIFTWGLFGALCLGGLLTAAQCKDPFGRLVAVGIVAVLFTQMAINTGMTIGLFPITGMTLPFISYGGSSLVAAWIMVGLLMNIGMRRPLYLAREAFEFDGKEGAEP